MPGIASATGLLAARVRPVYRPTSKRVDLTGCAKPAPFALRPFSGLFNPYPYGCSVLCNHPADCEAKEVVRRAKDTWATEGKALLLPEEMDMIRAGVLAGATANAADVGGNVNSDAAYADATAVPEELFRKYTETDSRPLTPAPTLASGPALTNRFAQEELSLACNLRERTTLVLDLRTSAQKLENDTFTWHALTLEPPPNPRKPEVSISKPILRRQLHSPMPSPALGAPPSPIAEICESDSAKNVEDDEESTSEEPVVIRRRGKRLRKRKCRRGSTYGQQTEVRDLLEPLETQVSQIGDVSRRTSLVFERNSDSVHTCNEDVVEQPPVLKKSLLPISALPMPPSFLTPDVLKHLSRELDREKIETEFSVKKRLALEEALRIKGEGYLGLRGSRQATINPVIGSIPRIFSRQAARFEILDSSSLQDLTPLQYLSKHVSISPGRKLIFGRIFNKFNRESLQGFRLMPPGDVQEALQEVIGEPLTEEQRRYWHSMIGEIEESLNFRTWCGVCAATERLICPLPQKEVDPPTWLEKADFEALERRLKTVQVNPRLAALLREIREK